MVERKRLEQDGLYVDSSDHWELLEKVIYIYDYNYTGKGVRASITIPIDLIRHLKLKHKDKILVAIKRSE